MAFTPKVLPTYPFLNDIHQPAVNNADGAKAASTLIDTKWQTATQSGFLGPNNFRCSDDPTGMYHDDNRVHPKLNELEQSAKDIAPRGYQVLRTYDEVMKAQALGETINRMTDYTIINPDTPYSNFNGTYEGIHTQADVGKVDLLPKAKPLITGNNQFIKSHDSQIAALQSLVRQLSEYIASYCR